MLTSLGVGFPFLGKLTACGSPGILRGSECFGGGSFDVPGGVEEYTLVPGLNETPFVLAHFDHQARRMRVDLYRVSDGKNVGQAMNLEYLPDQYGDRVLRLRVGREGYEGQQHIRCCGRHLLLQPDADEGAWRFVHC